MVEIHPLAFVERIHDNTNIHVVRFPGHTSHAVNTLYKKHILFGLSPLPVTVANEGL